MVTYTRPGPEGGPIISHRAGTLTGRLSDIRRTPGRKPVRWILVRIPTVRSNKPVAPAQEIAQFYVTRWVSELFFRWTKQVLRIKHFFEVSENAVAIQIAVALIAFLMLRLA
jgi:IS4 transposase